MPRRKTNDTKNGNRNRREEIVQAAARLFQKHGFSATSIVDIAKEVGLPKGGIYNHIESKEELLYEIITRGILTFIPIMREVKASNDSPQVKLQQLVFNNVLQLTKYHNFVQVFLHDGNFLSAEHFNEYKKFRHEVEMCFQEVLSQGMEDGVFRKSDVKLLAFAILGMCNWTTKWYRPRGHKSAEEIAAFFTETVTHMVRP